MTWQEFWDSVSVLQLVGWILGVLGIIAFLVKGWPKVRAFVKMVDSLSSLAEFMDDTTATLKAQDRKIAEIHHEVNYNNGSSVKDAVERVELGVKGLYSRIDTTDENAANLRTDLEQVRPHAPARKRAPKPKEQP